MKTIEIMRKLIAQPFDNLEEFTKELNRLCDIIEIEQDHDREMRQIADLKLNKLPYCTEISERCKIIAENEVLRKQIEITTFPLELQYGDLTNYIGYGQAETEKLVAISFGKLTEKGKYAGENMTKDKTSVPLFIAYFDKIESLEVLENLINIAKARLKELEGECKK